jgi:hypothetical protein
MINGMDLEYKRIQMGMNIKDNLLTVLKVGKVRFHIKKEDNILENGYLIKKMEKEK